MAPRKAGNISSRLRDCILESIHTKIHQGGGERAVNLGLIKYFSSPPFLITITRRPWPTEGLATVAPTLFHLITSTFPHTVCNTCATRGTPSRLPHWWRWIREFFDRWMDDPFIGSKRWPWRDEALNFSLFILNLLTFSLSVDSSSPLPIRSYWISYRVVWFLIDSLFLKREG